uniref:Ig-like domain-containing protein n=1 Tax=Verminephrobacter eiseniae TaxID=364317 RepID=UPI002AA2A7C3|nr:Ig-like domain-containing protein [Verminephrobacter eiseniae]
MATQVQLQMLISDTVLTVGETMTVTFETDHSREIRVTGGIASRNYVVGLSVENANGQMEIASWHQPAGMWVGTFHPNAGVEATGCYLRYTAPAKQVWSPGDNAMIDIPARDIRSPLFDIDTKPPTILAAETRITDASLTASETTTITFKFHERVVGLDRNDLAIEGTGEITNLQSTDGGTTWQVTVRAPTNMAANTVARGNQLKIGMSGIKDAKGNDGVGIQTIATYDIDSRPPSATIAVTPNPVTNNNDRLVTVTITFDEEVTGFTANNIDFSNANVGARPGADRTGALVRSTDGRTYTITYTAASDTEDATNTVRLLNLNTIRDTAGNAATVNPTSNNFEIDTRAPTVTITMDKERLTAGETATVTFTFSETVTGFSDASFVVDDANGTLSHLTQNATDGRIWTATFTPTASLSNTRSQISLKMDGIRDSRNNAANAQPAARSYTVDTAVFAIITATVNGRQLVLQYSDETALDPEQTHNAPNDAFVVLADGARIDVTGVVVDAAAKTITLTLDSAVTRGQQVSVAYNDPSTGDDQQAVQDATTGKDAASFAATPATNVTPPPPPPAPDASNAPDAPDSDRDGLSNALEDHGSPAMPAEPSGRSRPAWRAMATATVSKTASRAPSRQTAI